MRKEADILPSVAIPVNLNNKPNILNSSSDEMTRLIKNKFSNLNTTLENVDLINTLSTPSSVVITEEELTGDLPSEYGETRIVAQARDPHWAWVYWEYSSIERKKLEKKLGHFEFAHTELFLRIFNKTYSYSFEINLPEDCDNWYLSLNDSDCDYYVQLCIHIPSLGDEILATSEIIHLPSDKVSDNIAEWVPARPIKEDKNNEELNSSEIENSDFKEKVEEIDCFELHKAIEPDSKSYTHSFGSSDELLKRNK